MIRFSSDRMMHFRVVAVALMTVSVSCSPKEASPSATETGSFRFSLKLPSGAQINSITYKVSGAGIVPISGTLELSHSDVASALVSGLPAATGYLLEATAASTDGETSCTGHTSFDIVAARETAADLTLLCKASTGAGGVSIRGTFNNCPIVTAIGAAGTGRQPVAPIGGDIALFGKASDLDGDPICFKWRAEDPTVGSFGNPRDPNTAFTCSSPGIAILTLSVTDSVAGCDDPDGGSPDAGYATCAGHAATSVYCGLVEADGGVSDR